MALGWPALVVYGILVPRVEDLEALRVTSSEIALLTGITDGGSICRAGQPCLEHPGQRIYIVLPRALSTAAASVVEDTPAGLRTTVYPGYGALAFLVWAGCLYATWRYWVRGGIRMVTGSLKAS